MAAAESRVQAAALQARQVLEAKEKEWQRTLEERNATFDSLNRDVARLRADLVLARTATINVVATEGLLSVRPRELPAADPNVLHPSDPVLTGPGPSRRSPDDGISAAAGVVSTALASSAAKASPALSNSLERQTSSTSAQSVSDERRLLARADFLFSQADIAGARRFLEHAFQKGSARAAFRLAETYDGQSLQSLQIHGVRADMEKARALYEAAARGGIEEAKEKLQRLESAQRR
jgi:hypothetical protein